MKTTTLIKYALIAASLPLFAGCVVRERVVYRNPPPAATVVVDDPQPPPPQTDVITVAPGPLNVWFYAPGAYEWRGGNWVWYGGHWSARPRPGAVWVRSGWAHRGHGRVWVSAHWH